MELLYACSLPYEHSAVLFTQTINAPVAFAFLTPLILSCVTDISPFSPVTAHMSLPCTGPTDFFSSVIFEQFRRQYRAILFQGVRQDRKIKFAVEYALPRFTSNSFSISSCGFHFCRKFLYAVTISDVIPSVNSRFCPQTLYAISSPYPYCPQLNMYRSYCRN